MALVVRRLEPGDEAVLNLLAAEEADFDVADRSDASQPLAPAQARNYLANPAVLHWIAVDGDVVAGFVYCIVVPLRSGAGRELLLYEIGVREAWRRRGVGRALLDTMERWMRENSVAEVWVLADNAAAVDFYRACGFAIADDQPVYLIRHLG